MKTAIYIEDGVVQLVLTPESRFERNALQSFEDKPTETHIFVGAFYNCRGGWTRHAEYYPASLSRSGDDRDRSLILRIKSNDAPQQK